MLAGCVPVVMNVTAMPEVVGDAGILIDSQRPGGGGGRGAPGARARAWRVRGGSRAYSHGLPDGPPPRGDLESDGGGAAWLTFGRWRRLREQRRLRDDLLLDLGALVYELHRQGRRAPELLQEKAIELGKVDREVRELEDAMEQR